jgi:hypothetical protein
VSHANNFHLAFIQYIILVWSAKYKAGSPKWYMVMNSPFRPWAQTSPNKYPNTGSINRIHKTDHFSYSLEHQPREPTLWRRSGGNKKVK